MASLHCNSSVNSDANDEIKEKTASEMIETVAEPRGRVEVQESAWDSAKNSPKVILYSIGACASSMLWGFDIGKRAHFQPPSHNILLTFISRSKLYIHLTAGVQNGLWI